MFFQGTDVQLIQEAFSPALATWHYIYYVSLAPLILLNLLIALMGGASLHNSSTQVLRLVC